MSGSKLSIILAATALLVAVFLATPLAQAAGRLVLPKNSVGAAQIKKSAVTPAKIKAGAVTSPKIGKNAVAGAKVKDDSLTGADVLESGLGKVPSATNADSATNAVHADSANSATNATNATNATTASAPAALASGHTVRGFFAMRGQSDASNAVNHTQAEGISYGWRLPAPPTTHVILLGQGVPAGCSGNEADPDAAPGNLCVFEGFSYNRGVLYVCGAAGCQTRDGAMLIAESAGAGLWDSAGSWAVTAP
jgi:hypothetical protein